MLSVVDEQGLHSDVTSEASKAGSHRAPRRWMRSVLRVLALAGVFFGVLLVRTWTPDSSPAPSRPAVGERPMPTSPAIESKYGVRFVGIDITSGGGMIQVRYQVLDSAKAGAIHDEEATPTIIDGGVSYNLPGMPGHTHIGPVKKAGTTDYVLLANAGGGVKPGSTVTLRIGDLELRNVPVS